MWHLHNTSSLGTIGGSVSIEQSWWGAGYHPSIGFYCGKWRFHHESGFEPRNFNDTEAVEDHLRGNKNLLKSPEETFPRIISYTVSGFLTDMKIMTVYVEPNREVYLARTG